MIALPIYLQLYLPELGGSAGKSATQYHMTHTERCLFTFAFYPCLNSVGHL